MRILERNSVPAEIFDYVKDAINKSGSYRATATQAGLELSPIQELQSHDISPVVVHACKARSLTTQNIVDLFQLRGRLDITRTELDIPIADIEGHDDFVAETGRLDLKFWHELRFRAAIAKDKHAFEVTAAGITRRLKQVHPDAHCIGYAMPEKLSARLAMLRVLKYILSLPMSDLRDFGLPSPLSKWQQFEPTQFVADVHALFTTLRYPAVDGVQIAMMPAGLLVTQPGLGQFGSSSYPCSWQELVRSPSEFGRQHRDIQYAFDNYKNRKASFFKYSWILPDSLDVRILAEWAFRRACEIVSTFCSLENVSEGSQIFRIHSTPENLLLAWEMCLSIDRIVRTTVTLQCEDARRPSAIQVLDMGEMWTELVSVSRKSTPVDIWRSLFTRTGMLSIADRCLSCHPQIQQMTRGAIEHIFQHVTDTLRSSNWKGIREKQGEWAASIGGETLREPIEHWVASALRNMRNTCHGYVRNRDHKRDRTTIMEMDISDELSLLPIMWLTCFLGSPTRFVSGD